MIENTTPAPPAECWHVDKVRVRAGEAPQRIEPKEWAGPTKNGQHLALYARRSRGIYLATDCYPTARDAAQAMLAIEDELRQSDRLRVDTITAGLLRLSKARRLALKILDTVEA